VLLAAVEIIAVNCRLLARTAFGVNVATAWSAFMLTLPLTLLPLRVSLTVNDRAGEAIVAGFIASLKVALMVLGISTLPSAAVLTATLVAPWLGFEEVTAGPVLAPAVPVVPGVLMEPAVLVAPDGNVPGAMAFGAPATRSWLRV
jgi:hypothetical protein